MSFPSILTNNTPEFGKSWEKKELLSSRGNVPKRFQVLHGIVTHDATVPTLFY